MHIEIDKYAYLQSLIHQWDPRVKIISLLLAIVIFSFIDRIILLPILVCMAVLLLILSRIPLGYIFRRLKYVIFFLIPLSVLLSISSGGKAVYSFSVVTLYSEGMMLGLIISFRTLSMLTVFFIMLETTPFNQTIRALYSLKISEKLVGILFFAYRYVYVYLEELRKMKSALVVRGYKQRYNIHTLKTVSGVIGSIFVRSFEQADRVCSAMVLRGYSGKILIHSQFKTVWQDYFKLAVTICILIILTGIQFLI